MLADSSSRMWVFRESRRTVTSRSVVEGVASAVRALSAWCSRDALVDALLRAGELECGLADAGSAHACQAAAVTEALAAALVGLPVRSTWRELASSLEPVDLDSLSISPPEGYAYYALHPLDFAELASRAPFSGRRVAVVGIRSIGTTLSAIVAAALRRRGLRAGRITVRPTGHPFDRRTCLDSEQLRWIAWQRAGKAEFVVVDEGPGMSGSSFLSVGDALLAAGVERAHITFLCSRHADPGRLIARDAGYRWRAFRSFHVAPTAHVPPEAKIYVGGGEWRRHFCGAEAHWPAAWTQMERLKFFSADGRRLYKFEGLGRFGSEVSERARAIATAGFGPAPQEHASGFAEYAVVQGRPMAAAELSAATLERIAEYCAFRGAEFATSAAQSPLETMVRFNLGEEFGLDPGSVPCTLTTKRAVLTDSRMLPHEWLATAAGALKTDGASHGDDHFFPGPTDIAWDLAGAMVEWAMTSEAAQYLVQRYRERSGDDPRPRLPGFLLAYATFRMAYCAMAAFASRGSEEEARLRQAWRQYRALVEAQIQRARTTHAPGRECCLPPAAGDHVAAD